jgi:hypothetical protein
MDIKQAYDTVWKTAILINLWEKGIRGKVWRLIRQMNTDVITEIATRFGVTDPVHVQEGIRQGGVTSGLIFASLIDKAQSWLEDAGLGVEYAGSRVCCILLMDDIILIGASPQMLQKMLNEMDKLALQSHLAYSVTKSKIMLINAPESLPQRIWSVGELILQETLTYAYLGEILSATLAMHHHIIHLQ